MRVTAPVQASHRDAHSGDFRAGAYGEVDRVLAVAFLQRALPADWASDADTGVDAVYTTALNLAVQAPTSEGGFAVEGLQL